MEKRFMTLLATLLLFVGTALAQTMVKGTVTSQEDGQPVVGAAIKVVGTNTGTVTDVDGNFQISVPQGARLAVTYIGMQNQTVTARSNMRIVLVPEQHSIDEVMVVAYGTAKKSAYTGAASQVDASKLANIQTSNITTALTGSMAGVQTLQTNGQPGTSATVRIRGISSINGVNTPLYVVDGVPFDGDMSSLNPDDIEKITVLKDAVSTSLYGSRGANGVVMITTKRGQQGKATIKVDAKWGRVTREVSNYDVITNPQTYYEQLYNYYHNYYSLNKGLDAAKAYANAAASLSDPEAGPGYQIYTLPSGEYLVNQNGKFNPNAKLGYTDGKYYYTPDNWEKETFKPTLRQEYNASISGASDVFNYYGSFGYLDDQGTIEGSGFKRFTTRLNVDYKVRPWLTLGANISFVHTNSFSPDDQGSGSSTSSGNAFYVANNMAPVYPMYVCDAQGNIMMDNTTGKKIYDYGDQSIVPFARQFMGIANPLSDLQYNFREYAMDIFNGNWYAKFDLGYGFSATARLALNTDNTIFHSASSPKYGQSASYGGETIQELTRTNALTHQYLLNYLNSFGKHNVNLTAGFEGYRLKVEDFYAMGQNQYKMGDITVGNTIDNRRGSGSIHKYNTAGYFFTGNYNFDERFYGNIGIRRDATSAFHPDNRWGTFANVGLGWNLKKEAFLANFDALDMLKARFSYGQTGNDNHNQSTNYYTWYAYEDQYDMTGANGVFSDAVLAYKGNKDLKWEKTNAFDFGVDYSFFQGRLSGAVDLFLRSTSNLLDFKKVAMTNGYASYPVNVGTVQNYGAEFEVKYGIIQTKDLKWDASFNLTYQRNKIKKLSSDYEGGKYVSGSRIYREGESIYNLYMVHYEGVDPKTGEALYTGVKLDEKGNPVKDANGNYIDETTTDWQSAYTYNRKETGSILPKFFGGLGTTLTWKGFDLSVQTSFQLGGRVWDDGYQGLMDGGKNLSVGRNWHKDILKAWTPENTNTDVPRLDYGDQYTSSTSDRWLISSDYFSLDNVTLGYTLPRTLLNRAGIQGLRVYLSGENVALVSARKGADPRMSYYYVSTSWYTARRTLSAGIQLTF